MSDVGLTHIRKSAEFTFVGLFLPLCLALGIIQSRPLLRNNFTVNFLVQFYQLFPILNVLKVNLEVPPVKLLKTEFHISDVST